MNIKNINTLWELKESNYTPKSIKEEIRQNLIIKLKKTEKLFTEIIGFEDTVIPDLQRAMLSRHKV